MNIQRFKTFLCFEIAKLPMSGHKRMKWYKWGGVDCADSQSFIGRNVTLDTMNPQFIHIGRNVHITSGVIILTHYLKTNGGSMWYFGHVHIGDGAFIGVGSIICKDVTIGKNAIVAAGSVVTKDIPDDEIWGGNPAKFIKKRIPWE